MTIHLGAVLPRRSSSQPGSLGGKGPEASLARPLFGFAPGGACRALEVTFKAVGSYPTVSPLPAPKAGGFISVALSLGLPRPAVNRRHAFLESGLSSPIRCSHPAIRTRQLTRSAMIAMKFCSPLPKSLIGSAMVNAKNIEGAVKLMQQNIQILA